MNLPELPLAGAKPFDRVMLIDLDFTMLANLAHGPLTVAADDDVTSLLSQAVADEPWILGLPLVIGTLREAYAGPQLAEGTL